ncbi:MAG: hemerythrin domain-containing protein [Holophaga sp.]|nr:hemerythrin domain-containing protein [Holophaga sp.]
MIENLWNPGSQEIEAWKAAPLPDLITHIVQRYHLEARVELAHMENLAEEAVLLEGARHPSLLELREEIGRFCIGLRAHMAMEERSLFPYLLDPAHGRASGIQAGLMPPLIKLLEDGHQAETGLFVRLRGLSAEPLPGSGNLQARFLHCFRTLEKSLQAHIFLETQVLFRRTP